MLPVHRALMLFRGAHVVFTHKDSVDEVAKGPGRQAKDRAEGPCPSP